jgi:hypothetical protein
MVTVLMVAGSAAVVTPLVNAGGSQRGNPLAKQLIKVVYY